jgi:hypothetical protein
MKNKEKIEEKVLQLEESLKEYESIWNNDEHLNNNGLPIDIKQDVSYNIIKNQIDALKWVLKD